MRPPLRALFAPIPPPRPPCSRCFAAAARAGTGSSLPGRPSPPRGPREPAEPRRPARRDGHAGAKRTTPAGRSPDRGALLGFRSAVGAAVSGRTDARGSADAVWAAYRALGSARGLTGDDVKNAVRYLAGHAVAGRSGARGDGGAADEAAGRARWVLVDAAAAGIGIPDKAVAWFVQISDRRLGTYAACRDLRDFLLSECGVPMSAKLLSGLLRNVAHGGNYTAFLKLLHESLPDIASGDVDSYLVNMFVKAVATASPRAAEDLEGYPSRQNLVADLAVPLWAIDGDRGALRSRMPRQDREELQKDADTSLRRAVLEGRAPRLADLCAPGMPPGSTAPVDKIAQILCFSASRFRQGHHRIVDGQTPSAAVEAFCAWRRRGLARAALELLLGDPFRIPPGRAQFSVLIAGAARDRDAAGGGELLSRMAELGVAPNREVYNAVIGLHARTGMLDRAAGTVAEMRAAGYPPDSTTGMVLLDGVLVPGSDGRAAKAAMRTLSRAGIGVRASHWNKALHHFARAGRLEDMEEVLAAMEPGWDEVTVATCSRAYSRSGRADRLLRFLRRAPAGTLSNGATWSAAVLCFLRQHGDEPHESRFRGYAHALCCAVLDGTPVDRPSLPPESGGFPFLDVPPPPTKPGLLLVVFDCMHRGFAGQRRAALEEKGRAFLVREGYPQAAGMGAEEMHAMLERSGGVRPREADG